MRGSGEDSDLANNLNFDQPRSAKVREEGKGLQNWGLVAARPSEERAPEQSSFESGYIYYGFKGHWLLYQTAPVSTSPYGGTDFRDH